MRLVSILLFIFKNKQSPLGLPPNNSISFDAYTMKLVPSKPARKRRRFGSAQGLIQIADDFTEPLEDLRDYT